MDILQKKTVKDLRAILREYKKIHCKPYSKLKKAQMIELIKFHGISEHDMKKAEKLIPKPKPKPKPKPESVRDEHDTIMKSRTKSRDDALNTLANADKKIRIAKEKKTANKEPPKATDDYITRIHKKYPSTNIPNLKQADKWLRENFIDNGFVDNYSMGMRDQIKVPTKRSIRGHPEGNRPIELAKQINNAQANARAIIKPILPTFHRAMENYVFVEIFSNIVIDKYSVDTLMDFLTLDHKFIAPFGLAYNIRYVETRSPEEIEKTVKK